MMESRATSDFFAGLARFLILTFMVPFSVMGSSGSATTSLMVSASPVNY
jgi:hypothetical protein